MANLSAQKPGLAGTELTLAGAAGGGDSFDNQGKQFFVVRNDGATARTITFDAPNACNNGYTGSAHDLVVDGLLDTPGTVTKGAVAGGVNAEDTFYYAVTALDRAGNETPASAEVNQATAGANLTVSLSWAAIENAVSYRVYKGTATGVYDEYFTVTTPAKVDTGVAGTAFGPGAAPSDAFPPPPLMVVGPFSPGRYNDANGRVQVTYSGAADLYVAVLTVD